MSVGMYLGERSEPHTGVFNRDFAWYVGRYVCLSWSKKRRRKYVGQTRACSKSVLCGKIRPVTPVLLISTIPLSLERSSGGKGSGNG